MQPEHENPEHGNDVKVEYSGTGFYVSLAIILLSAITLLILAIQNNKELTIAFLALDFALPLFAVILGTALIAVVLGELIGVVWRRQRRRRLEQQAELERLRSERVARVGSTTVTDFRDGDTDDLPEEPDPSYPNETKEPSRPEEASDMTPESETTRR
jgi:uncharacterized integral membrane protein